MSRSNNYSEWEDPLSDLVSKSFDGALEKEELEYLRGRLKSDESARLFFARFAMLQSQLEDHFSLPLNEENSSVTSPVSRKQSPFSFSRLVPQSSLLFILLLIGVWSGIGALGYHLYVTKIGSRQVETLAAKDQANAHQYKQQTITQGSVELTLPTGVELFITAPATFQVTGENEIRLSQGMLLANVTTEAGKGFAVNTPSGRVVDLGTTFGVEVDPSGASNVQVFKGEVELASSSGDKKTLLEGNAMRCESVNQQWQRTEKLSDNFYRVFQKHSSNVVLFYEPHEGLWGPDEFTGISYVIYSAIPFTERLRDPIRNKLKSSSDDKQKWRFSANDFALAHLAIVHFDEVTGKWALHFNEVSIEFTPVSTDLILARIDLKGQNLPQGIEGRHQVTFYQEDYGTIHGISYGYQTSDIDIRSDRIDGIDNFADHTLKGTYFIRKAE